MAQNPGARISHQQQIPKTFCYQGNWINNPCGTPGSTKHMLGVSLYRVDLLYIHLIISQPEGNKITWLMSYVKHLAAHGLPETSLAHCQQHKDKPQGTKELLSGHETKWSLNMWRRPLITCSSCGKHYQLHHHHRFEFYKSSLEGSSQSCICFANQFKENYKYGSKCCVFSMGRREY